MKLDKFTKLAEELASYAMKLGYLTEDVTVRIIQDENGIIEKVVLTCGSHTVHGGSLTILGELDEYGNME